MATINATNLSLLDWAKRLDPNGTVPTVAELLSQDNEMLEDMVFMEGNLPTGHRVAVRTGLPAVYFRLLNQGVPVSKSTTAQVDEACAMLEARSHIDAKLLALNGNAASFRMSEDMAFIEAMNQQMAETLIYGNAATDPKTFVGMATRYSSLSAGNAQNIVSAGGSGSDNTSVYLVVWGDNKVFGIFPKGSQAGLRHRDLGEESVPDANGNYYQAARTLYQWDAGLVVKDWRFVVRIPNIDVSDLQGLTGTQALSASTAIHKAMAKAIDRIPGFSNGKACFYANKTLMSYFRIAAMEKTINVLNIEKGLSQFGDPKLGTPTFLGIPIRKVDRILNTEAAVT